ncbi:polysaccharide biosynthesis/export family protein [Kordia sp. YSTF-M3]|uniref:Polysaccharide biosynthesis/export family protein n=1 Tax=Kordia aestuariivivens TaxID=2759037 RepID=A0ABR7Q9B1_9FLAO|nr:polysaccharide biosynthesis/export family protein [Kordia aestuariivivens]MBC8755154.1 polysaccharide biosynthesis/export family protein [Kordia aestuariivivens]
MKLKASISILVTFFLLTSCVSNKDLTYFGDKGNGDELLAQNIKLNEKPYRVQISDLLSIMIKSSDQKLVAMFQPVASEDGSNNGTSEQSLYFNGFTVSKHGNIEIPTLGKMNVLAYTLTEIEEAIKKKLLEDYFKEEADLFVVVKLAGLRFTVTGEVGNTGIYVLYQDRVNIIEALASSGDITTVGNRKDVLIIRQYPQGQKIHHIDLTSIEAFNSPYYYIKPNDMIYVKPLKQKSLGTGTTLIQSITTIVTVLSLVTSVIVLSRNL